MKEGLSNRLYFDVTSKSLNKKNEELCGDKVEVSVIPCNPNVAK